MKKATPCLLFRCDASPRVGFGHLMRSLAIAAEIRRIRDVAPVFVMRASPAAEYEVRRAGHDLIQIPDDPALDAASWLLDTAARLAPSGVVFDVRDHLPRDAVRTLKQVAGPVIVVDDDSERRLEADLAVYPPVPQADMLSWEGFRGRVEIGWEWVVLRQGMVAGFKPGLARITAGAPSKILITMGGSDPAGLTLAAIDALAIIDRPCQTTVLVGPAFVHRDRLPAATPQLSYVEGNFGDRMLDAVAGADLAVASMGVTAYELAALGLPAVLLSLTGGHAASASALDAAGAAISLGVHDRVRAETIAAAVSALAGDPARRSAMAAAGPALIDGRGAARVAAELDRMAFACVAS
jgi:spore coat polysaccharide biosynthesis protein SpsF